MLRPRLWRSSGAVPAAAAAVPGPPVPSSAASVSVSRLPLAGSARDDLRHVHDPQVRSSEAHSVTVVTPDQAGRRKNYRLQYSSSFVDLQ